MWLFGQRPYHVLSGGGILAVFSDPQEAGGCFLFPYLVAIPGRCLLLGRHGGLVLPAAARALLRTRPAVLFSGGAAAAYGDSSALAPPAHSPAPLGTRPAGSTLALIDPASGKLERLDTPFTSYTGPTLAVHEVRLRREGVVLGAGSHWGRQGKRASGSRMDRLPSAAPV